MPDPPPRCPAAAPEQAGQPSPSARTAAVSGPRRHRRRHGRWRLRRRCRRRRMAEGYARHRARVGSWAWPPPDRASSPPAVAALVRQPADQPNRPTSPTGQPADRAVHLSISARGRPRTSDGPKAAEGAPRGKGTRFPARHTGAAVAIWPPTVKFVDLNPG